MALETTSGLLSLMPLIAGAFPARQKALNRGLAFSFYIIRKGIIKWKHEIKKESTHISHVILLTSY